MILNNKFCTISYTWSDFARLEDKVCKKFDFFFKQHFLPLVSKSISATNYSPLILQKWEIIRRYIASNLWLSAYMLDISAYPTSVSGSKFIALFEHNFHISILPRHLHGINKVNELHIFAAQRFQSSKTFIIPQITRNPCVVRYHISIMLLRKDDEWFFKVSTSNIHAHIIHHDCAKLKNLYYSAHT